MEFFAGFGFIALFLVFSILLAVGVLLLPWLFSRFGLVPRKPSPVKNAPYECGMETIGKTWVQFNFRYYFYALLFLIFDIEVVFLYPWAVAYGKMGAFALAEMAIFIAILVLGYLYAWRKGALEWK